MSKNEKMKDSYFLISRLNCKQWVTHCGNYFEMDLVINVKNRVKKSTTTYVVNSCRLGASLIQRKKSSLFNKRHQNNWTSINKIKKKKRWNLDAHLLPYTKINSKMVIDINVILANLGTIHLRGMLYFHFSRFSRL